ncbi:synaptotagmin-15-like [Palaemon carinicauda]|uniref:synaptotagmin-15-like n=1 Tax=Palaemon carinicauda TaxID=392227 RepID=UPI0035B63B2E
MEQSPPERLSPISAYLKFPREPIRRHHSLKYIFNGELASQGYRPGSQTPPLPYHVLPYMSDKTRHHSLTRLKDLTSHVLPGRTTASQFEQDRHQKILLGRTAWVRLNLLESYTVPNCVTAKELDERALKLTFFDVDRDRKHQVIGHVLFLLKDLVPWEGKRMLRRDLEREVSLSPRDLGQLELSLCYNNNLERLTVTVGSAKQLKVDDYLRQDKYELQARVALMQQTKISKTKKTAVVKGTDSPSFNESFNFKVAPDALDTTAVCIHITAGKKSDNVIGRVQLGSFMFSRGKALEHWESMLAKKREHVKQWHALS